MDEEFFYKTVCHEKIFAEMMRIIKHIDKDHNGFITTTEMDDILKKIYPQLADFEL